MSQDYQVEILSHNSIYGKKIKEEMYGRSIKTYYSLPNNGVNKDTGFLILIAGFGGKAEANVYCKMRSQFADEYNLVTIQCDYFGSEFMQQGKDLKEGISKNKLEQFFTSEEINLICKNNKVSLSMLMKLGSEKNQSTELNIYEELVDENLENFNDMGIMQALDNIIVLSSIMNDLNEKRLECNRNKVIFYGHSHGGYLCYLCNILAPHLISLIIDNSAWLIPKYLRTNRVLTMWEKNIKCDLIFSYLAKKTLDRTLWDLDYLYRDIDNMTRIICYHGKEDKLVNYQDKKRFCGKINNCFYNEISHGDGKIFYSANHGDANFIELFKKVMNENKFYLERKTENQLNEIFLENNRKIYIIKYKNNLPYVTVKLKKLASQIEDLRELVVLYKIDEFNKILMECLNDLNIYSKNLNNEQIKTFNECMMNLSFAMQDKDYLLVTDILKFEIIYLFSECNSLKINE